jgi:hypothetical protein
LRDDEFCKTTDYSGFLPSSQVGISNLSAFCCSLPQGRQNGRFVVMPWVFFVAILPAFKPKSCFGAAYNLMP